MSQVPIWFERKFDFRFPVEQYPNLCIRLRGAPSRLEDVLHDAPRDVLIRKPGDKWSAQEHAGHLLDLEPLWLARVDDFLTDGTTLTAADLSNRKTDEANHNGCELTKILVEFRTARTRLVDHVGKFQPAFFNVPSCIRDSSSPCVSWIICTLSRSTTIIISRESGNCSTPPDRRGWVNRQILINGVTGEVKHYFKWTVSRLTRTWRRFFPYSVSSAWSCGPA